MFPERKQVGDATLNLQSKIQIFLITTYKVRQNKINNMDIIMIVLCVFNIVMAALLKELSGVIGWFVCLLYVIKSRLK